MKNVRYAAVDYDGTEKLFRGIPGRYGDRWIHYEDEFTGKVMAEGTTLKKGTIERLTGRKRCWPDYPVKIITYTGKRYGCKSSGIRHGIRSIRCKIKDILRWRIK